MKVGSAMGSGTGAILLLLIISNAVRLVEHYPGLRAEIGRVKFSQLEEPMRQRLAALREDVFLTYYTSSPGRMPSQMRHVEQSVRELLRSMKSAAQGKLEYQVVDPDTHPDLRSYASRRGVAPFRVRHISRDGHSEQTVWSALTIEYGTREPLGIHAVGPEHIPKLQPILLEHLRQLEQPGRPLFALAAPDGFRELREALQKRGRVIEVNLDGGAPIPAEADVLFWIGPASIDSSRLRELNGFLQQGHSLVLAASRHKAEIRLEGDLPKVRFTPRAFGAEPLLLELGLRPFEGLVLDTQADELTSAKGPVPAPFLIRCLAYDQDFHTLRGQPNGSLLFDTPTPFTLHSERLWERRLTAEVLATTSQGTWVQELPRGLVPFQSLVTERGDPAPKLPLMVLLRHSDPWRGLVLASASSSPLADGFFSSPSKTHGPLLEVLLDNLASPERLVYARVGGAESGLLPELSPASRLLWRLSSVLLVPGLIAGAAVAASQGRLKAGFMDHSATLRWALILIGLSLGALSLFTWGTERFDLRLDLTRGKANSLGPEIGRVTREMAAASKVQVDLVFSRAERLPPAIRPLAKQIDVLLAALQRTGADLLVHRIHPEEMEPEEQKKLHAQGIEAASLTTRVEEVSRYEKFYGTIVLTSGARREVLPFPTAASFENLEFRLAFALWRLHSGRHPHIGFAADVPRLTPAEAHENYQTKGLFAPSGTDVYSVAREAVRQCDFRLTHINPNKPVVPEDIDLLVWLQPRRPAAAMLQAMADYLHRGGRVLLAAQHFNMQSRQYRGTTFQTVYWPQPQSPEVERMYFPEIGIKLVRQVLFDELKTQAAVESQIHDQSRPEFERMASALPFLIRASTSNFDQGSVVTQGLGDQAFLWASYLEIDEKCLHDLGIRAMPLIHTSERTWSYAWTGGWIPEALLMGPPVDDGKPQWLGRKPMAVLFEGSFPLPKASLVESSNPTPAGTEDGFPGSGRKAAMPGRLLFIACSEVFKNQWILGPEFRGDHLLLNGIAALALPSDLAPVMTRRSVAPGFDHVQPWQRLAWRAFVVVALPATVMVFGCRRMWRQSRILTHSAQSEVLSPQDKAAGKLASASKNRWSLAVAVLAGLSLWNGFLSYREAAQRGSMERLGRFVPRAVRESIRLAIIKLQTGGQTHVYGRQQGVWRCLSYGNAVADQRAIERLVQKIIDAEGVARSAPSSRAEDYGLDVPGMHTISLHGPDFVKDPRNRDLQLLIQVGSSISEREGSYARLGGSQIIWAIDRDLREALSPGPGQNLPPLLDLFVVPASWSAAAQGLRQVLVESRGEKYELSLQMVDPTQTPPQDGRPPWEWILKTQGRSLQPNQTLAVSYTAFLRRAPWQDVLHPKLHQSLELTKPRARLALVPFEGEPLELLLRTGNQGGNAVMWNAEFGTAFVVSQQVLNLLFPPPGSLVGPRKDNPWELWLKQTPGT